MSHPHSIESTVEDANVELLRATGWAVATIVGRYCVAWRGSDEVVFTWQSGGWRAVSGRSAGRQGAQVA
jgi:hypothetical protein